MKLPVFPNRLARLAERLPALPVSVALTTLLNRAAWRVLGELDWKSLRGRRFRVHVRDLGISAYFSVGDDGFVPQLDERAEVTFTATAEDFARLALRIEDPDTLFFNRRLLIEGDTNLGLTVKNMLDTVELETLAGSMPLGIGGAMLKLRERAMTRLGS